MTIDRREAQHPRPFPDTGEQWARFLSGLVHELKTPLASLSMIAELLARQDGFRPGEKAGRYTDNVRQLVREMQILVDDTGTLARLASGKKRVAREPISLPDLVDSVAEACRSRGWERGISLATDLEKGLPARIWTDGGVLLEALTELLEIGSLLAERQLTLRVAASDAELVFTIEPDRGCAPGEDPETLFDPFSGGLSRILRQRRDARPLAPVLARELARALGGDAEAVSQGQRTVCVLRVPLEVVDGEG